MTAPPLSEAEALLLGDAAPARFPRDLEEMVWARCRVMFEEIAGLGVEKVEQFLDDVGGAGAQARLCADRQLRGCIVADRGSATIFTDPIDPPDERRFTIAHELAHYALDYELPRRRALRALGVAIVPVLDGDQAPTAEQRVEAALAGVPLGTYFWLMEREADGKISRPSVLAAELRADALALRLLAPAEHVRRRLPRRTYSETERDRFLRDAEPVLAEQFGLPPRAADEYARKTLWPYVRLADSRAWLGL